MVSIIEFLEARIAEDEAEAIEMGGREWADGAWSQEHEARIHAECAAKRAVVADHCPWFGTESAAEAMDWCDRCADWARESWQETDHLDYPCPTIRHIAAIYSGHADYRQEWAIG